MSQASNSRVRKYLCVLLSVGSMLVFSVLATGSTEEKPRAVVTRYLRALVHLNHEEMAACLTDPYVSRYRGVERMEHPEQMRDARELERALHTHWSYHIVSTQGDEVRVEEVEANDAYQLLAVGKRTQTVSYFVRNGKIYKAEFIGYRHEQGDWQEANRLFGEWLATQAPEKTAGVLKGGAPVYTAAAAPRLLELMKKYHTALRQ